MKEYHENNYTLKPIFYIFYFNKLKKIATPSDQMYASYFKEGQSAFF